MNVFLDMCYMFLMGGVIGYGIELFFRRFVSAKKWINPGFLHGPFLPLYGFGLLLLFGISSIDFHIENRGLSIFVTLVTMCAGMTIIEYIDGIIFIKGLHIKLWDYSNMKGNIKGIICPAFSTLWIIGGTVYYFVLHDIFRFLLDFFVENAFYLSFPLGICYGILLIDIVISSQAASKLGRLAKNSKIIVSYEQYKIERSAARRRNKEKFTFFNSTYPQIKQFIDSYKEKSKDLVGKIIYIDPEEEKVKRKKTPEK